MDFKVFGFARYRGLPHLWQEVVTTPAGFSNLVENLWAELQKRKQGITRGAQPDFPALITIIEEFSNCRSERLIRLIAEARAPNMFFILTTQHPTVDVISTSIKANLITGIAFRTRSQVGSQLIIGSPDAVSLKMRGDYLVQSPSHLARVQAGWVTVPKEAEPSDLGALMNYLRRQECAA